MTDSPGKQDKEQENVAETQDKTNREKEKEKGKGKEDSEDSGKKDKKETAPPKSVSKNKSKNKSVDHDSDDEKEKEKEKGKEKEKDEENEDKKKKEVEDKSDNINPKKKSASIRNPESVRNNDVSSLPKISSNRKKVEEKEADKDKKKEKNARKKRDRKKGSKNKTSTRETTSVREQAKLKHRYATPKNEIELDSLELETPLSTHCKMLEEYKLALEQIYISLHVIMRRGNGTTGFDNIKSEKGNTAPERLFKPLMLATVFWSSATEFQPALFDSVKSNTTQIAAAERYLQERGPKHMKKIKKFIFRHYPNYVELKQSLLKLNKTRPDSVHEKEDLLKKISSFVKEKYKEGKHAHAVEIQCAISEIMLYHRVTEKNWYNIAERNISKTQFSPEPFDFSQFDKK